MIPTYACNYQVNVHAKYCKDTTIYKTNSTCLCNNINWLASVLGCLSCAGNLENKNIQGVKKFCRINGRVELSQDQVWFAYQRFNDTITNASLTTQGTNVTIDRPVILLSLEVELYRKAYGKYLGNFDDSIYYGGAIYGYWAVVLVLAATINWSNCIFQNRANSSKRCTRLVESHLLLPALASKAHAETLSLGPIEATIPSRLEALILGMFAVLLTTMTFINTEPVDDDPIYYTKNHGQLRYLVDRSGIISTMLAPLVVMFASRNNLLQWLTKWQYARFLTFHRWVARVMFVLTVVHAAGYTKLLGSFYLGEMEAAYSKAGVVAIVASSLMLVQGVLYVRRRWYETFQVMHFVLGLCWLVGCAIHVNELGFVYFVYPVAIIWGTDRLVRITRILHFGFPVADLQLIANDLIKIEIPVPKSWQLRGTIGYAFIHVLKPKYFWQSHPFTFMHSPTSQKRMVCYCKVKTGLTSDLHLNLLSEVNNNARIKVGVEGPYEVTSRIVQTNLMVFVAGGSGIAGIYQEVAFQIKGLVQNPPNCIKLIWVVRDSSSVNWFHAELQALQEASVHVMVYITHGAEMTPVSRLATDEKGIGSGKNSLRPTPSLTPLDGGASTSLSDLMSITFLYGRPDLIQLVTTSVTECESSVSFTTCGHPGMVDDLRAAVCQCMKNTPNKTIYFYDQLQVWV